MATYLWSTLSDGQLVAFDPSADRLEFDELGLTAAQVMLTETAQGLRFSTSGKSVTLTESLRNVSISNVSFNNGSGSVLFVGDGSVGTTADDGQGGYGGGSAADHFIGLGGNDSMDGHGGGDRLDGGEGFDFAQYSRDGAVTASLANPAANTGDAAGDVYVSIEGLVGSPHDDILIGDDGANELYGGPERGNDKLYGLNGADTLRGGNGDDDLHGGAGADVLDGAAGFDTADYRDAGTAVTANLTTPSLNTGDAGGDNYLSIEGLIGSQFGDTLVGSGANNVLSALRGDDRLEGRSGNDHLTGGLGADALDGGPGIDFARYDNATASVRVDLAGIFGGDGEGLGDTFDFVEGVFGSAFDDLIFGDAGVNDLRGNNGADSLHGREGNDRLYGGNGDDGLVGNQHQDTLYGEAGDDELQGNDGNDVLFGMAGADKLYGGPGTDYARYDNSTLGVRLDLAGLLTGTNDAQGDAFASVEGVYGSIFADEIYGDVLTNDLRGNNGDDMLTGRGGKDTLLGGNGIDTLDGGDDNDLLYGQEANDTLNGGEGLDSLFGGAGADSLTGGAGNDLFYFIRGEAGGDQVTDLDGRGGGLGDRLMFAGYGAGATFVNLNATDWQINSGDNLTHEIIRLLNGAPVHASDFTFV